MLLRRPRLAPALGIAAVVLAGVFAATTEVGVDGQWQGVFLLHGKEGLPLELKDDLFLGDGSRLIVGVSFSRIRKVLRGAGPSHPGEPWLDLDWDEATGSGMVWNHLADGTDLVTSFSRYEDSDGKTPRGLFVGGALAEIAEGEGSQNESGMSFRDARGWHHVWCDVNEALLDLERITYPGSWRFLGSRVLIHDRDRIVLESSHEIPLKGGDLRMDRFAYFRAGKPWFKLGIRIVNAGDAPVRFSYAYGDEPWVGEFGDASGNIGWIRGAVLRTEATIDPRENRWAGILDERSHVANFIAWIGDELPDRVYFSNEAGSAELKPGRPLASNEVFIGLEWLRRELQPGAGTSILLAVGLANVGSGTLQPELPAGAGPP